MSELEFATEKRLGPCLHVRRLEGHHLDGARVRPRMDWQLGRRITRQGNGAENSLSHSSIVLWNRALSRGGLSKVKCLYGYTATLYHGSKHHAWEPPVRERDVRWTARALRAPPTGRAQPGAARGGLREPGRARKGLTRVSAVGRLVSEVGLRPRLLHGMANYMCYATPKVQTGLSCLF